jgi:hypothetical protein
MFMSFLTIIGVVKLLQARKANGGGGYTELGLVTYGIYGKYFVEISLAMS